MLNLECDGSPCHGWIIELLSGRRYSARYGQRHRAWDSLWLRMPSAGGMGCGAEGLLGLLLIYLKEEEISFRNHWLRY